MKVREQEPDAVAHHPTVDGPAQHLWHPDLHRVKQRPPACVHRHAIRLKPSRHEQYSPVRFYLATLVAAATARLEAFDLERVDWYSKAQCHDPASSDCTDS